MQIIVFLPVILILKRGQGRMFQLLRNNILGPFFESILQWVGKEMLWHGIHYVVIFHDHGIVSQTFTKHNYWDGHGSVAVQSTWVLWLRSSNNYSKMYIVWVAAGVCGAWLALCRTTARVVSAQSLACYQCKVNCTSADACHQSCLWCSWTTAKSVLI